MNSSWRDQAACKNGAPREWVPTAAEASGSARVKAQRAICAGCPVAARCLDDALANPEWSLGVWGGTTTDERAGVATELRRVVGGGADVRGGPVWSRFADDPGMVRDVTVAVEAPVELAAILSFRVDLPVVAAVALVARHEQTLSAIIAARDDQPLWLVYLAAEVGGETVRAERREGNAIRMRGVRAGGSVPVGTVAAEGVRQAA